MNMTTALLLSLPALLAAQVKDIDGWEPTKWGMSVEQARDALGGRAAETTPEKDVGLIRRLRIPKFEVSQIPLEIWFEFSPDTSELRSVQMTVQDGVGRGGAFERLKQLLIEKYGPQSDQDIKTERNAFGSTRVDKTTLWRMPSTSILLTWSDYGDIGYVSVRYSKVVKSGL